MLCIVLPLCYTLLMLMLYYNVSISNYTVNLYVSMYTITIYNTLFTLYSYYTILYYIILHNTGRQCMASCFYLMRQFDDVMIYMNSIKAYMYNDDDFNYNYGITLAATRYVYILCIYNVYV